MNQLAPSVDQLDNIDALIEQSSQEEDFEKACDLLIQAAELNQQLKPEPEAPWLRLMLFHLPKSKLSINP